MQLVGWNARRQGYSGLWMTTYDLGLEKEPVALREPAARPEAAPALAAEQRTAVPRPVSLAVGAAKGAALPFLASACLLILAFAALLLLDGGWQAAIAGRSGRVQPG
jgi:hypothetical protein